MTQPHREDTLALIATTPEHCLDCCRPIPLNVKLHKELVTFDLKNCEQRGVQWQSPRKPQ